MIFYDNQKRAQTGGDIDQVYASNPSRFKHDTQTFYLKQLVQENIFSPNLTQHITCLDIGCGQGALLHILYNMLAERKLVGLTPSNFYGLDVSEVGIRQADINYPQYNWIIDSFQEFCTFGTKKFNLDSSFSIILNRGGLTSLQSMDEYEAMLEHVNSLLSMDGIYFFSQNTNYYRIWMNGMLNARADKLKPVPSIFKMNSTIFECIRFYKLPGDYIGIYRKRKSSTTVSRNNAFVQQPLSRREPFAVNFHMSNGKHPTLFVSGDDIASCFLTSHTLSQNELENFYFDVPPIYQEDRMRVEHELSSLAKSINTGSKKPRFFVSNFHIHSLATRAIPIVKDLLIEQWEDVKFVYFPRRFITIRDICKFYPEIRSSLPNSILLGIGLEDHRFEEGCPHPLVDLREYINRLDWLFDTLVKDNIRPIWCLTRFEETGIMFNNKYFYLMNETKKYNEVELELCKKYQIMVVDLRELSKFSNVKLRKEAIFRLKEAIKSQTNMLLSQIEDNIQTGPNENFPYLVPLSGSLIFDDGTSQPLTSVETEHLFYSAPDDIYCMQLNSTVYDIGFINGVDFYSRSCQAKYCLKITQIRNKSLPDVLVMGDSIRMRIRDLTGYGQKTAFLLKGEVNILHIGENYGCSTAHLQLIREGRVINSLQPVVAHVNAGLHDVMTNRITKQYDGYSDINTYGNNVREIIRALKSIPTVKIVIWATMTPIHPEWHDKKPDGTLQQYVRSQEDIVAYNACAIKIAQEEGAWINDLYTAVQEASLEKCILRDGVHLSDYGSTLLGELVASKIREALNSI